MKRIAFSFALLCVSVGCAESVPESMSQESLARHIEEIAGETRNSPNVVEFQYDGVAMACVSDSTYDRMRLIAPITKRDTVEAHHLESMLIANFHTTLDARYALSDGVIYAAFLSPMSTLTRPQLESAMRQVAALAQNFGSSYSGGELTYGLEPGEER